MIGGERAVARGERGAAEIGELLGVQFYGQAMRTGGIEDAGDLGGREGDALAEPIDGVGKLLARHQGKLTGAQTSSM